jgi:predicted transcriptional regulator of viral defense system
METSDTTDTDTIMTYQKMDVVDTLIKLYEESEEQKCPTVREVTEIVKVGRNYMSVLLRFVRINKSKVIKPL